MISSFGGISGANDLTERRDSRIRSRIELSCWVKGETCVMRDTFRSLVLNGMIFHYFVRAVAIRPGEELNPGRLGSMLDIRCVVPFERYRRGARISFSARAPFNGRRTSRRLVQRPRTSRASARVQLRRLRRKVSRSQRSACEYCSLRS